MNWAEFIATQNPVFVSESTWCRRPVC